MCTTKGEAVLGHRTPRLSSAAYAIEAAEIWVFRSRARYAKSETLPVNFRNADGELDERKGLAMGRSYTALAF